MAGIVRPLPFLLKENRVLRRKRRRRAWRCSGRRYSKVIPDAKELMFPVASASVWVVTARPWTVRFLKWTPMTLTDADLPCRTIGFFTSEATFVK